MRTDWVTVVFDGSAAAVFSAAAAFVAAVFVSRRQSGADRELAEDQRRHDRALAEEQREGDRKLARADARRQAAVGVLTALNDMESILISSAAMPTLRDVAEAITRAGQKWSIARALAPSVDLDTLRIVQDLVSTRPPSEDLAALRQWVIEDQLVGLEAAINVMSAALAEL